MDDLIKAVPHLSDLADLSGEQVANIGSQTMNHEVWLKLAARVNAVLADKDVDGVVITHGTDTMEETAYFLSPRRARATSPWCWSVPCAPPRPPAPTAPRTFTTPSHWPPIPEARGLGPLVVLNDEIHYAHEAQKMNSTSLNTFQSPNRGRAGVMNVGTMHSLLEEHHPPHHEE